MADLILAADAAYPFNLALLPTGCKVVLGYVGAYGATPHIWSKAEIDLVKSTGRDWWPIWTPHQSNMSTAAGRAAAAGASPSCDMLGIARTRPVFIDIEDGTWFRDPVGAGACVAAFKLEMKRRGRPNAFGYVPVAAGSDWVAHWTRVKPVTLPAGWVGQQYVNALAAGAYDLSVFDPVALRQAPAPTNPTGQIEGQQDMMLVIDASTHAQFVMFDNGGLAYVPDTEPDADNLAAKLGPPVPLSSAFLSARPGYLTPGS